MTTMTRKRKFVAAAVAGMFLAGVPAMAKSAEKGAKKEVSAEKVAERMGVDEATAAKIIEIRAKYRAESEGSQAALKAAVEKLRSLVASKETSDDEIRAQLDALKKIQADREASREKMMAEISTAVGPRKSAEMILKMVDKRKEAAKEQGKAKGKAKGKNAQESGDQDSWGIESGPGY